jgi:drug/metabolite transporter (DMT)-like permease
MPPMVPTEQPPSRARVAVVLTVALLAISSSALLVRGMVADPLAVAAWRTLLAALVLSPGLRSARPDRSDLAWSALAGALLGVHFWAWFASVHATTVLRSTLLVCLTPGWTAALEWLTSGRRPSLRFVAGLAVAFPGLALLGTHEGEATWWGDGLAVFAGLLWSGYLLVGQRVRQRLDATPYMALVCGWAALTLFGLALAGQVPVTGFPARTWGLLAAAVAFPQLLGHQGFAWAVKHVAPSTLSALTLLEPVGAALLAALLLSELPTAREWAGMALVLAGTFASTRKGHR